MRPLELPEHRVNKLMRMLIRWILMALKARLRPRLILLALGT